MKSTAKSMRFFIWGGLFFSLFSTLSYAQNLSSGKEPEIRNEFSEDPLGSQIRPQNPDPKKGIKP